MSKTNIHDYRDIIDLPYQKSTRHPHMPRIDRAAQFAPFAALTGHKEVVKETARITEKRKIIDENRQAILNSSLQIILSKIALQPQIKVTYFVADCKKQGGQYITIIQSVKKFDEFNRILILMDGTKIKIDDIYELEYLKNSI